MAAAAEPVSAKVGVKREDQLLVAVLGQSDERLATTLVLGLTGIDERHERSGVGQRQLERRRSDSKSANASPVCRARPPSECTAPMTSASCATGRSARVR